METKQRSGVMNGIRNINQLINSLRCQGYDAGDLVIIMHPDDCKRIDDEYLPNHDYIDTKFHHHYLIQGVRIIEDHHYVRPGWFKILSLEKEMDL